MVCAERRVGLPAGLPRAGAGIAEFDLPTILVLASAALLTAGFGCGEPVVMGFGDTTGLTEVGSGADSCFEMASAAVPGCGGAADALGKDGVMLFCAASTLLNPWTCALRASELVLAARF